MEPHAPLFPSFIAPLSDLYGASSYRVAEAQAYACDLDDLDREELALEQTVRALVDRKAPTPIGLNFHRANASVPQSSSCSGNGNGGGVNGTRTASRLQRPSSDGSAVAVNVPAMQRGYHGPVAEDADHDEEDEEEEMEEEDDDEEEMDELDEEDHGSVAEEDEEDDLFFDDEGEEEDEEDEEDDIGLDSAAEEEDHVHHDDSMDLSM